MCENRIVSEHINNLNMNFVEDLNQLKLIELSVHSNAWITNRCVESTEVITSYGLGNWMSSQSIVSIYFYLKSSVKFKLFIKCKVPEGKSSIELSIGQSSHIINIEGNYYQWFSVAKLRAIGSGYVRLDLKGIDKSGPFFADVSHLMFVFKYDQNSIEFIRDICSDHTYWSRRGPSVHLMYEFESSKEDEYYYNEVTVPEGYDPIGSFFMAIGFDCGYFGIQVNSEEERRVLFSVWSPQETDDPKQLMDENNVQIISKSDYTDCRVFGGEGCGGQSILQYMWCPEVTYKFLVRGRPDPNESKQSIYTAWFASQTDSTWNLIASVIRPKSGQYLSRFHSFVENFDENTGFLTRKAYFGNQWVCNSSGVWHEVTRAQLTGDSTAKNKVRLDFDGGVETLQNKCQLFYLKNCGFFEGKTELLTKFRRYQNQIKPQIDFTKLIQ